MISYDFFKKRELKLTIINFPSKHPPEPEQLMTDNVRFLTHISRLPHLQSKNYGITRHISCH